MWFARWISNILTENSSFWFLFLFIVEINPLFGETINTIINSIPIISAILPAIDTSNKIATLYPITDAIAPTIKLNTIISLSLFVIRYAVIGGPIIKATTNIEPTASKEVTAVIETKDISI